MRRWTAALAFLAVAAGPAWGQGADSAVLQITPTVAPDGDGFRVGVEGRARLPDGAVLLLKLLPVDAGGQAKPPFTATRAEVRQGAFSSPPWRVVRADLTVPRFRIEARLADDQDPQLRRALTRSAGQCHATVDFAIGDWRSRCAQLATLARALVERVNAVTRHRDGLLAMAREMSAQKLSASDWKAWPGREELLRAHAQCVAAFKSPLATGTFPHACDRGLFLVSQFESLANTIESELRGGVGAGNPERKATLQLADRSVPPDYLSEFQSVVAPEGAQQLVQCLQEVAAALGAAPADDPRAAAPRAAPPATAERDLRLILEQFQAFYEIPWSVNVSAEKQNLLEAIDECRQLSDAVKTGGSDAAALERVEGARKRVRERLDSLRTNLKGRLGM